MKLIWAPLVFGVSVFFYAGLGMVTYPIWRRFLPQQAAADGTLHRGAQLWDGMFIDTWASMTIYALIGLVLVVAIPYLMRVAIGVDGQLAGRILPVARHLNQNRKAGQKTG